MTLNKRNKKILENDDYSYKSQYRGIKSYILKLLIAFCKIFNLSHRIVLYRAFKYKIRAKSMLNIQAVNN